MSDILIKEASTRDGVSLGKLYGHALRDSFDDPLIVGQAANGEPILADDWRLEKLARAANKSLEGAE